GSPVTSAAALATLQTVQDEKLVANAAKMGMHLISGLRTLQQRFPFIGDIRGRGLMIGVEITVEGAPDKHLTSEIQKICIARNLLLLTCGTSGNVIRWIPPLIVTAEQIDHALATFEGALNGVTKE
ncbi:MAG: aminotransferase class III-fold pyridoxal phosphate-dependent enzyme, partial [Anaerolineae bacterium]|nr:aminotransferase class III-fold pyridoxal phosphate-dependent enzyme [Anaerolineae bacterium]